VHTSGGKVGLARGGDRWKDVRLFYDMHVQTRQRLGAPVQPLRFFRLLWAQVLQQGMGYVLVALQDDTPLASAVFLHWGQTLTYKYSASDPAYWRLRPNNLLLWHAIRWGCGNGYAVFDWGKTAPENEGLRQFKSGWGSSEAALHYSVLADRPPEARTASRGHALLSSVLQRAPAWVGRMIGELLYGHYG